MVSIDKLLPCPLCGDLPSVKIEKSDYAEVVCASCHLYVMDRIGQQAVDRWNRLPRRAEPVFQ